MADEIRFDWNKANLEHIARHGVERLEVEQVFENGETAIDYETVAGEDRWTAIGRTNQGRVLIVTWTMRGEAIRPVTARPASKALSCDYLEGRI